MKNRRVNGIDAGPRSGRSQLEVTPVAFESGDSPQSNAGEDIWGNLIALGFQLLEVGLEALVRYRPLDGYVCKHPPHTANHPGSSRTLTSAARLKSRNCTRISSAFNNVICHELQGNRPVVEYGLNFEHCTPFCHNLSVLKSLALRLRANADFVRSVFGARLMLWPQKEPAEQKVAHQDWPTVSFISRNPGFR
jgi:hypothetical protein